MTTLDTTNPHEVRDLVRERYGAIAASDDKPSCCGPTSACCGSDASSAHLGYSEGELASLPDGADLGLGCGNPGAIAALRPGEVVLDLGSGAGIDAFLAARRVGAEGRVIGVDMTPPMIAKARANAATSGAANVTFRLGEIEHLPVADASVDVIISNCVINLSPEKAAVFREAFRTLRPGGRLAISDIVALAPLPEKARRDLALYSGCIGGAEEIGVLEAMLRDAGFVDIRIGPLREASRAMIREWAPGSRLEDFVASATIEARRPV